MNQEILNELLILVQRDEDTRTRLLEQGSLYDGYADAMQQIHRENAIWLNEIVSDQGWPGIAMVGLEGSRAAWTVAQHANCTPDLQRKFLELLTDAAKKSDAPKKQVAMLTDRIRFNEEKPQRYGTVFDWNENGELDCLVENRAGLDQLRAAMDLAPFQEELEKQKEKVEAEGGKPPEDYSAYKSRQRKWAENVGWL